MVGGLMMRVNIGCGATPTEGWINLDNSVAVRAARRPVLLHGLRLAGVLSGESLDLAAAARAENIQWADAVQRIPLPGGSAEAIYSAHMIEHLDRDEARRFLAEVRRVLRPAGIVRLAAPDLRLLVDEYMRSDDADEFMARTYLAQSRPAGVAGRVRSAVVGPRHHLWMYDGKSLTGLLRQAGFDQVTVLEPGETTIANPGCLDLKERAEESVYVEAVNPR
jgi:SAM-dependent methyltransferase